MLEVLQEPFAKALKAADRIAPKKHPVFVLTHCLLRAKENKLWIEATNLDQCLKLRIDATVTEEFAIGLESTFLANHIGEYPKQPITIAFDQGKMLATFKSGKSEAPIKGIDVDEWPTLPTADPDPLLSMPFGDLQTMIAQTAIAASEDSATRPTTCGVCVDVTGDVLRMRAIDGYSVAQTLHSIDPVDQAVTAIVPAKALLMLAGIFDAGDTVKIAFNASHAFFWTDDKQFSSRLIDGQFPDLDRIFAQVNATAPETIEVDRMALLSVIKTAVPFGTGESDTLSMTIWGSVLQCATRQYEGKRYETAIDLKQSANSATWTGQIGLLREMVNVLATPTILLEMRGPSAILILKEPGNERGVWGIMPVVQK